jgi:hypothetical protein
LKFSGHGYAVIVYSAHNFIHVPSNPKGDHTIIKSSLDTDNDLLPQSKLCHFLDHASWLDTERLEQDLHSDVWVGPAERDEFGDAVKMPEALPVAAIAVRDTFLDFDVLQRSQLRLGQGLWVASADHGGQLDGVRAKWKDQLATVDRALHAGHVSELAADELEDAVVGSFERSGVLLSKDELLVGLAIFFVGSASNGAGGR